MLPAPHYKQPGGRGHTRSMLTLPQQAGGGGGSVHQQQQLYQTQSQSNLAAPSYGQPHKMKLKPDLLCCVCGQTGRELLQCGNRYCTFRAHRDVRCSAHSPSALVTLVWPNMPHRKLMRDATRYESLIENVDCEVDGADVMSRFLAEPFEAVGSQSEWYCSGDCQAEVRAATAAANGTQPQPPRRRTANALAIGVLCVDGLLERRLFVFDELQSLVPDVLVLTKTRCLDVATCSTGTRALRATQHDGLQPGGSLWRYYQQCDYEVLCSSGQTAEGGVCLYCRRAPHALQSAYECVYSQRISIDPVEPGIVVDSATASALPQPPPPPQPPPKMTRRSRQRQHQQSAAAAAVSGSQQQQQHIVIDMLIVRHVSLNCAVAGLYWHDTQAQQLTQSQLAGVLQTLSTILSCVCDITRASALLVAGTFNCNYSNTQAALDAWRQSFEWVLSARQLLPLQGTATNTPQQQQQQHVFQQTQPQQPAAAVSSYVSGSNSGRRRMKPHRQQQQQQHNADAQPPSSGRTQSMYGGQPSQRLAYMSRLRQLLKNAYFIDDDSQVERIVSQVKLATSQEHPEWKQNEAALIDFIKTLDTPNDRNKLLKIFYCGYRLGSAPYTINDLNGEDADDWDTNQRWDDLAYVADAYVDVYVDPEEGCNGQSQPQSEDNSDEDDSDEMQMMSPIMEMSNETSAAMQLSAPTPAPRSSSRASSLSPAPAAPASTVPQQQPGVVYHGVARFMQQQQRMHDSTTSLHDDHTTTDSYTQSPKLRSRTQSDTTISRLSGIGGVGSPAAGNWPTPTAGSSNSSHTVGHRRTNELVFAGPADYFLLSQVSTEEHTLSGQRSDKQQRILYLCTVPYDPR